jgi:adenylate cyclase
MGIEIERKFLVTGDAWRLGITGVSYAQGYLAHGAGMTVRVRTAGEQAFLTIKGPVTGISRSEFEYPIPTEDALEMLQLCEGPIVQKTRFRIPYAGHLWEVDEFAGPNAGLVLAEVELLSPEEPVVLPPWIGREVTGDIRYYNSRLSVHPFQHWAEQTA